MDNAKLIGALFFIIAAIVVILMIILSSAGVFEGFCGGKKNEKN